jgi:dihydroorotase
VNARQSGYNSFDNLMTLLIKNGRVVDPSRMIDEPLDLRIDEGKIVELGKRLQSNGQVLDASTLIIAPGFIDMHVHLREPGQTESETIETGLKAAAAGGFTAVACMPNTVPPNDSLQTTEFILQKAENQPVQVLPIAAITKLQQGMELSDIDQLCRHGVVAFSDDGKPVVDSSLMRKAIEQASRHEALIIDHCEDPYLFRGGAMNESAVASELGLPGIPAAAEEIMVARNILLAKFTGARVHLAHLSTSGSMALLRWAKATGIRVSCEVTPHHFTLTDEAVRKYGTNAKMNPPLRSQHDVDAVLAAIADGTVDAIASDHAPHNKEKKSVEFTKAAFGIVGLETSVSLGLDQLLNRCIIGLNRFIELYSLNPAKLLKLDRGIYVGADANLTLFDPLRTIKVDASRFHSKSDNTPFDGWTVKGGPEYTICSGILCKAAM